MMRHRFLDPTKQPVINQAALDDGEEFVNFSAMTFLKRSLDFQPRLTGEMLELLFTCLGLENSLEMLSAFSHGSGKSLQAPFAGLQHKYDEAEITDADDLARETLSLVHRRGKNLIRAFIKSMALRRNLWVNRRKICRVKQGRQSLS